MNKAVTILSFSPRNDGNCMNISKFLENYHKQTNVHIHSISSETVPACCGCDYECLKPGVGCPTMTQPQKQMMNDVMNSDLVYYIVPNFCGYPCASFYAFNERTVGYFNMNREMTRQYQQIRKRFIIVSNTENEMFRDAMKRQTDAEPDILYMKTGKYGKRSTSGDILDSEEAKADLTAWLNQNSSV